MREYNIGQNLVLILKELIFSSPDSSSFGSYSSCHQNPVPTLIFTLVSKISRINIIHAF